jgi:acyl transferase domain-containing protein
VHSCGLVVARCCSVLITCWVQGEYAALCFAGALTFETAVSLAESRGICADSSNGLFQSSKFAPATIHLALVT